MSRFIRPFSCFAKLYELLNFTNFVKTLGIFFFKDIWLTECFIFRGQAAWFIRWFLLPMIRTVLDNMRETELWLDNQAIIHIHLVDYLCTIIIGITGEIKLFCLAGLMLCYNFRNTPAASRNLSNYYLILVLVCCCCLWIVDT